MDLCPTTPNIFSIAKLSLCGPSCLRHRFPLNCISTGQHPIGTEQCHSHTPVMVFSGLSAFLEKEKKNQKREKKERKKREEKKKKATIAIEHALVQ